MSIEIKEISFEEATVYKSAAAKVSVPITKTKNCKWFGIFVDGQLAGITCAAWIGKPDKKHARPRATYIDPEFRGKGLYAKLLDYVMNYYDIMGVKKASAYLNPVLIRYWKRRGFIQKKIMPGGWIYIEKEY